MTLTLEVTGEAVEDGSPLTTLKLDDKNMLGTEYEVLRKIIEQMVHAMNTLHQQVEKGKEDNEQLLDAVQHLEQQISSFEVRSRECEDTCQEIRLQLGTMVLEAQRAPDEKQEAEARSEVSQKDLSEVLQKMDQVMTEVESAKRSQQSDMSAHNRKISEVEEMMNRHQEFFDDDLEGRLAQNDDDRSAIKADLEAIRQSLEECNNRKASKVEVGDIAFHVATLDEASAANSRKLDEAGKHFLKLDGLADLVNSNQSRMQEMWAAVGKESQELREWASSALLQLRSAVQSKMSEQEALSHVGELRKEVRDLAPFVSEAMARVEASVSHKAEASEVQRLQEDIESLNTGRLGRPKQLLVGTKCLACDRTVSTADATDRGPISLSDRRQEEELWNEVQRSLDKKPEHRQLGQKDVLKYVAIHVGNPASSIGSRGSFETRNNRDESPGGHYLMRVGGGGGALSRPQTQSGSERSPPREAPTLYRVPPRRPGKSFSSAAPPLPGTPRDTSRPMPNNSLRAALRGAAENVPSPMDLAHPPRSAPESHYSPVRMQPGAHSGMTQPHATDYDIFDMDSDGDAYVIDDSRSPVSR